MKIRRVFKTILILRFCLTKVKTAADPITMCTRFHASVDETGRTLKQRVTEYKRAARNADSNNVRTVKQIKIAYRDKAHENGIKAHAGSLNYVTGAFIDANWNPLS